MVFIVSAVSEYEIVVIKAFYKRTTLLKLLASNLTRDWLRLAGCKHTSLVIFLNF